MNSWPAPLTMVRGTGLDTVVTSVSNHIASPEFSIDRFQINEQLTNFYLFCWKITIVDMVKNG